MHIESFKNIRKKIISYLLLLMTMVVMGCGDSDKIIFDFLRFDSQEVRYFLEGRPTSIAQLEELDGGLIKVTLPGITLGNLGFIIPVIVERPNALEYQIITADTVVYAFFSSLQNGSLYNSRDFGGSGTIVIEYLECVDRKDGSRECPWEGNFDFKLFNNEQESVEFSDGEFRITQILP